MDKVKETRDRYRYWLTIPTRWQDGDPYGHMNNVVYYSFFDTVLTRMLLDEGVLEREGRSPIGLCVESQCRFLAPVEFPDCLDAGLRIGRVGNSSLRYEIGLFRQGSDVVVAHGHFVHVFVDRQTRSPVTLDEEARRRMSRLIVAA